MIQHTFQLGREFVKLHVLLRLLALAPSGGAAKAMIAAGQVCVDGVVEVRKACKIRGNQLVRVADDEVRVVAAEAINMPLPMDATEPPLSSETDSE